MIDPALAARNRQQAHDAARKARNDERRRVIALSILQASPVEPVRMGRDVDVASWRDPEDTNVQRRTPKMVSGHRRIDTLIRLHLGGTVTKEHVAAGFRFRDDHELSDGARPGSERTEIRGSSGAGGPDDVQLAAIARFRAAVEAVGKGPSTMVAHVVLLTRSLTAWAEARACSVSLAPG